MASFNKRSSLRKVKKVARKVRGKVIKRYFNKGYSPKVGTIMKDVMMLKKALNVEKKKTDISLLATSAVSFAQFSNAAFTADGIFTADITPVIPQNATNSGRNGNSVKLVSCLDMQINQSASTVNEFRYKWFIVCRPDASVAATASTIKDNMFEVSPFNGVRDYHSNRDPEYFHQVRIIKSGYGKMSQDQITSAIGLRQHKVPLRLNHHLKYNTDATTTTTKNQLCLFILADSGNTFSITGAQVQFTIRYYYVDN
jgi:hypothetical protein